jgi:hypothetical protein
VRVEVEVSLGPSSVRTAGRSRISGHDVERMAAAITTLMETIARRVMPRFR